MNYKCNSLESCSSLRLINRSIFAYVYVQKIFYRNVTAIHAIGTFKQLTPYIYINAHFMSENNNIYI